jgi:hypothetical protein
VTVASVVVVWSVVVGSVTTTTGALGATWTGAFFAGGVFDTADAFSAVVVTAGSSTMGAWRTTA